MERWDKIIIGAGLYGLYAALFCGKRGERVLVLEGEDAPFRLFLGSDAVKAAQAAWEGRLRELQAWQGVSRQSDGGKGERP